MSAKQKLIEKVRSILKQEDKNWKFKSVNGDDVLFKKTRSFFHHDIMSFSVYDENKIIVTVDDGSEWGYLVGYFVEEDLIKLVKDYIDKAEEEKALKILKSI